MNGYRYSILLLPLLLAAPLHADTNPAEAFAQALSAAALERTRYRVRYEPAYRAIAYPGGDVPADTGVCTDVVIRSYRGVGVDLQRLVHEDMAAHFEAYPSRRIWGLKRPDRNIDHRRVPNLQTFFRRHGEALSVSRNPADYHPGDLVTWRVTGNAPHIGIISARRDPHSGRPLIIHNIGLGPELEDGLFDFPITGHYRYVPKS